MKRNAVRWTGTRTGRKVAVGGLFVSGSISISSHNLVFVVLILIGSMLSHNQWVVKEKAVICSYSKLQKYVQRANKECSTVAEGHCCSCATGRQVWNLWFVFSAGFPELPLSGHLNACGFPFKGPVTSLRSDWLMACVVIKMRLTTAAGPIRAGL